MRTSAEVSPRPANESLRRAAGNCICSIANHDQMHLIQRQYLSLLQFLLSLCSDLCYR